MKYGIVKNYVGGSFVESETNQIDIMSPLDGSVIGKVGMSGPSELALAVAAAKKAQPMWGRMTFKARAEVLYTYRQLLLTHRDELAEINHTENGKSITEAYAGIDKAVELTEFACSIPQIVSGRHQEVSAGVECRTTRIPLGIVSSIAPFNFPLMVPHWTVPNAIAMGNAMILKPSELTPVSGARMAELWQEAGLPAGILNVVNGGKEIVEAICDHPDIAAVSFVGSTPVAKLVYKRCAASYKKVLSLGGAKNHLLVVPDADTDMTAKDILASVTGMSGQRCMAASVLISIGNTDHIVNKIIDMARAMVPGEDLPPLISLQAIKKIERYLEQAEKSGARIIVDGRTFKTHINNTGYFMGPSIIDYRAGGVMSDEEVFGPTLELVPAKDLDEALAIHKASPYGNAASIFTQSGRTAQEAIKAFSAGMCGVNIGVPVPREPFSFGGMNASKFGSGDITGMLSLDFWSNLKKVTSKWSPPKKVNWMS
jgi:malonate-semialdehyde dehydrogenase (acetylating) / methylmalonate-semialdehyde dehydrogenase